MQFETLCNLIEAATPPQLRALAQLVLRLQGYADAWITDGPYDGGVDLRLLSVPPNPLPIAVQASVEKKWQVKLRSDADKVKTRLKLDRMFFVSSRRIPQASFLEVQSEIIQSTGVTVSPIDQQAIASLVITHHKLPEALALLDIPEASGASPAAPADRRLDAAFAYAFFAPEVRAFRETIRERCLMLALYHVGGEAPLDEVCQSAALLLGMRADEATRLRSDVDRLRQSTRILARNGTVRLPAEEILTLDSLRALRNREEDDLRRQIEALFVTEGMQPLADAVSAAMRGIGALLIRQGKSFDALNDDIRPRLRRLRSELSAFGLRDGQRAEAVLTEILECARKSPLGRHLAAGALYQALTALNRDAFLRALDARSASLVLDASVAIPMFCALFHGSVHQRFFLVAEELHHRAKRLDFALQLPKVWLEEMAAHLLLALDYRELADADPEGLRMSKNAYVAYYASKHHEEQSDDFTSFLASFGLTQQLAHRASVDHHGARAQLETSLRRQLAHYTIEIVDTPYHPLHLKQVERDWDWGLYELGWDRRAEILGRHDKQVLAWLVGLDPLHAPLLITWDRLLKKVRPDDAPGGTLDPLAVCELLSLIHGEAMPPEALRFAALELTEDEAERSAVVLDALVRIERTGLTDARLVQAALKFKADYLREHHHVPDVEELTQAWNALRPRTP